MPRQMLWVPEDAVRATVIQRVPFFDTDAMGIVHHANYIRYMELARIRWMDEHTRPYREWVERGFHFATTRVDVRYHQAARFDDVLSIATWLAWVRAASLRMGYEIRRAEVLLTSAESEHALVDLQGKPCRIPADWRDGLRAKLAIPPS